MVQYQGHFNDLHFTEAALSSPLISGDQLRIPVRGLFPLKNHPLVRLTKGPVSGHLLFAGVLKSERELGEYVGDPTNPQGFKEARRENDGPFPVPVSLTNVDEFHFEGYLENPPAWIEDWAVRACNFILEVTDF